MTAEIDLSPLSLASSSHMAAWAFPIIPNWHSSLASTRHAVWNQRSAKLCPSGSDCLGIALEKNTMPGALPRATRRFADRWG